MIFRRFALFFALFLLTGIGYTFADSSIGDVSVQFCNNDTASTQLNLIADAGVASDICVQFTNNSLADVMVKAGFIDGTITEDSARTKACQNEGEITKFGQYVTFDTQPFLLAAGKSITKQAVMKFPSGYNGLIHGCLTYYIAKSNPIISSERSMFNVLVRKANFVDVLLGGKLERNLVDTTAGVPSLSTHIDPTNKHLVSEILFENKGNVIENVSLSGTISNIFGYSRQITGNVLKIEGGDKGTLHIDIGEIPFYKGSYTVDLSIVSQPKVSFDVTIPPTIQEPLVFHKVFTVFFVPYMLLLILLALILVIRLLKKFFSKFHFVAVAATPPPAV